MKPWDIPYAERFADRKPKVFIGILAFGDVYAEILQSWIQFSIGLGAKYKDKFEIYVGVATRMEQYRARNALILGARQLGADFILMADDDHPPSDCPDMIELFYKAEKPFQGIITCQRRYDGYPQPALLKYVEETNEARWMSPDEVPTVSGEVDIVGGGVNWFDATLFDFMGSPFWWPYPDENRKVWFIPHTRFGLDVQFALKVKERLGFKPWVNLDVNVGHVTTVRNVIRIPNGELKDGRLCIETMDDHAEGSAGRAAVSVPGAVGPVRNTEYGTVPSANGHDAVAVVCQ